MTDNSAICKSTCHILTQKYYIREDDGSERALDCRMEVLADSNGVFLESKDVTDGRFITEALSIPTPELAVEVARVILDEYAEPSTPSPMELDEIKFLTPEVQARVGHELWRLENHCRSPHGPVDAHGAYELLNHLEAIAKYLDIKPVPYTGK